MIAAAVVLLAPVLVIGGVLGLVVPGIGSSLLRDHGLPRQSGLPQVGAVVPRRAAVGRCGSAPHVGLLAQGGGGVTAVRRPDSAAASAAAAGRSGRSGRLVDIPRGVLFHVGAAPAVLGEERLAHRVQLLELLGGGGRRGGRPRPGGPGLLAVGAGVAARREALAGCRGP